MITIAVIKIVIDSITLCILFKYKKKLYELSVNEQGIPPLQLRKLILNKIK